MVVNTEGWCHGLIESESLLTIAWNRPLPVAFRQVSMCNEPLRELANAGASGSIFYLTLDDEFIVKTVQHKEGELLLKLLPAYFMVSRLRSHSLFIGRVMNYAAVGGTFGVK